MSNELSEVLEARREVLMDRYRKLNDEMRDVSREIAAIDAYYRTRLGTNSPARAPQSGRRQQIIDALRAANGALARRDLIERLNLKGDRLVEKSVSNALGSLKKAGLLVHHDGLYSLAD